MKIEVLYYERDNDNEHHGTLINVDKQYAHIITVNNTIVVWPLDLIVVDDPEWGYENSSTMYVPELKIKNVPWE